MMTPAKKILWRHLDGTVEVLRPGLLVLIQLQRGRPDYDPLPDLRALRPSLRAEEIAGFLAQDIDLLREEEKLRAAGAPQAMITPFLAFHRELKAGGKTLDDALALIIAKDCWEGGETKVMDAAAVPNNFNDPLRVFRTALDFDATGCKFDMPKAREIHKAKLRTIRAPKLTALDVEFMRAIERDDKAKQAAVGAQKQALRDVTSDPAIAAAMTPEDLKAVLPDALRPAG